MMKIAPPQPFFAGRKPTPKENAAAIVSSLLSGMSEQDLQSVQAAVDQFQRAANLPDAPAESSRSVQHGAAFTEDVYNQVQSAMAEVKGQKLKNPEERGKLLQQKLMADPGFVRRFEVGNIGLHALEKEQTPSIVIITPKPVPKKQYMDLIRGLTLHWLDTPIPAGQWIVDMDNLKRIYCTSDSGDMAALRRRQQANTNAIQEEFSQVASGLNSLNRLA